MKAFPPKRREARLPVRVKRAQSLQATQQPEAAKPSSQRQLVEHLQTVLAKVDAMPVLTKELGCQALDCFELVDKIRTRYREKARNLLLEQPGAIANWHAAETPQRRLSPDTAKVFDALSGSFLIDMEEFLAACSTSLTAVRNLLAERNPHLSPDELEHKLNRVLSDLISFEKVTRLSRSKDRQLHLTLNDDDE